jgi:hypothetical protein
MITAPVSLLPLRDLFFILCNILRIVGQSSNYRAHHILYSWSCSEHVSYCFPIDEKELMLACHHKVNQLLKDLAIWRGREVI